MFKVMKHNADGHGVVVTQCGTVVKNYADAENLKARMRAVLPRGHSFWYTIEPA